MKIIKHAPKPVIQPPPTVDLVGLLPEQVDLIFMLLGNVRRDDLIKVGMTPELSRNMWTHLSNGLYAVNTLDGHNRVSHLNAVGDAFDKSSTVTSITTYRKEN